MAPRSARMRPGAGLPRLLLPLRLLGCLGGASGAGPEEGYAPLAPGRLCSLTELLSYGWGSVPLPVCHEHCLQHPACSHFSWLPGRWCHRYRGCSAGMPTPPGWREDEVVIYEMLRSPVLGEPEASPSAVTPLEDPLPETPLPEALLPEDPLPEMPLPETPLTEPPLPELSRQEAPLPETPLSEPPLPETPVPEAPLPVAPLTEAPVAEASLAEAPPTEAPLLEAAVLEAPLPQAELPETAAAGARAEALTQGEVAKAEEVQAEAPGPDPACWVGAITAEVCCDLRQGPRGNEGCWDGVFTFARCCAGLPSKLPAKPPVDANDPPVPTGTAPEATSCWETVSSKAGDVQFTAADCCNTQHGPHGNLLCWSDDFTFELCCAQFNAEKCSIKRTVEALQLTAALCLAWLLVFLVLSAYGDSKVSDMNGSMEEGYGRLAVLDNAKFLLSVYVVASHVRVMPEARMMLGEVCGDFSEFHTRTFCLVSGMLSRDACSPRAMRSLAFKIVLPLILFCIALEPLLLRLARGQPLLPADIYARKVVDNIFHADASRVCWYWFGLACWRLCACPLSALRPCARLLAALGLSALAGYAKLGQTWVYYDREGAFKMNMALACLPIFVVGQLLPLRWVLERVRLTWTTMAVGAGLLATAYGLQTSPAGLEVMDGIPSFGWAHLAARHCESGEAVALYWVRGLFKNVLELSKGLVFLFLCCPRSHSVITELGKHSIYPYLLHIVVLDWLGPVVKTMTPACQLLVLPPAITVALASWPVRLLFRPFLEPAWLERLLAAPEGPAGEGG